MRKKRLIRSIKKDKIIPLAMFCSIATALIITMLGMWYYHYKIQEVVSLKSDDYYSYAYHYVMISEDADDPFWESVYEGALEKGKEYNTYVEKLGSNLSISYSLEDLLKIAIAAKVDGIIVEPNGEESIIELINEADEEGITVVTVLEDAPTSNRKSFIGINSYNQGQEYAKQVLEVIGDRESNVKVLLNANSKDTSQNIIYASIRENVENENIHIEPATVNTQSTFSSEEDIRDIIMDTVNPPDVLVCLTAVDTLCAYQAVVDYNKVGEIDIIGYYDSETILSAIEKSIIHSTIAIDGKQMGAYCVEALREYYELKRVSNYISVDINIITLDNLKTYKNGTSEESNQ